MLDFSSPFLEKGEKLVCFGDSLTAQQCSYVNHLKAALPDDLPCPALLKYIILR